METAYIEVYDCREFDTSSPTGEAAKNALAGKKPQKAGKNVTTMKVQFNPSSLSFSSGMATEAKNKKEKADISCSDNGATRTAPSENENSEVKVKMQLIFDRTVYRDCSVQPEVDSFIALVQNAFVRQVAFYWGTMCYSGIVDSVDAEYVLFNDQGVPMRATVDFGLKGVFIR